MLGGNLGSLLYGDVSVMIIRINYNWQESLMLHTKFRGNQPAGSREEDFEGFSIYGHGGHLGHVTNII